MSEISEIKEKLAAIESLLQRLPEIQAAVLIQMYDEYKTEKFFGRKPSDLWTIPPPNER